MGYLKVNLKLRLFLFLIGTATLLYGVLTFELGKLVEKGLTRPKKTSLFLTT